MIKLEYFTEEDFGLLISWVATHEFMVQWSGSHFTFPLDHAQLKQYINDANKEGGSAYIYKVLAAETDEIVGHISLGRIDRQNETARIGKVLLSHAARGRGLGTEMIRHILRIAFEELKLNRVSLGVFDFNKGAIKCYKKAGFQIEGLLRQTNKVNEKYWSIHEMSILKSEWLEETGLKTIQSNV